MQFDTVFQLIQAETNSGNFLSRTKEIEAHAEEDRKNHAKCLSHYEEIRLENIKLRQENEKLKEENDKYKRTQKKRKSEYDLNS